MDNQLAIKIILIALFVVLGVVLVLPGRGARRLAIRRIVLLLATIAGIVAIAFPELVNSLANSVGVGRGTDLVLYALVVAFLSFTVTTYLRFRDLETNYTRLARRMALNEAPRLPEQDDEPDA